jgi:hypothetical protein
MQISKAIELIQKNEIEQLQVLCSKFETLNDLPIDVFFEKLIKVRNTLTKKADLIIFLVKGRYKNLLFNSLEEYLEKKETIDSVCNDLDFNPLYNFCKDEIMFNKKYYENEYIVNLALGKLQRNENYEYETLCFFEETNANFALTFEFEAKTDEVKNIWFCNHFESDRLGLNDKFTRKFDVYVDECKSFVKTEAFIKIESYTKLLSNELGHYFDKFITHEELSDLNSEIKTREIFFNERNQFKLANEWSVLCENILKLHDLFYYEGECREVLKDYEKIGKNYNITPCLWKAYNYYLNNNLLSIKNVDFFEKYCTEFDDYFEIGSELKLKIRKADLVSVKKYIEIAWNLKCEE